MQLSKLHKGLTDEQIRAVILTTFGSETEVTRITMMKGGQFNTTYDVEGTFPEQRVILRVSPENKEHLLSFEQDMMAVEPITYARMAQQGIPCTHVIHYDGSCSVIERPYMVMKYIESIQLNDDSITSEEYSMLQEELGKYTRQMHDITSDLFGWPQPDGSVKGSESWSEIVVRFSKEIADLCREHHLLKPEVIDKFEHYYISHRELFDEITVPSLVHNDLWDPNVLIRKEQDGKPHIAAIIDADRAMFADREFDFVLNKNDPRFIKGYGLKLDMNEKALTRRKSYQVLWTFANLFIHEVQIELFEEAEKLKIEAIESLKNL